MTLIVRRALMACVLVAPLAVASCVEVSPPQSPQRAPTTQSLPRVRFHAKYAGVATFDLPGFISACRCRPNLSVRYVHWSAPPDMTMPRFMLAHGIVPLIELQPLGLPLRSILLGRADWWLISWARAIRDLHAPVLVSFAPEANGTRYSYGYHQTPATLYVAAWRYVVTLFARAGASNVRWVWIMIGGLRGTAPLAPLWPGDAWVEMVGVDGYMLYPRATARAIFGPTITAIRRLTRKPVLITETAASPAAGKARAVRELVALVNRRHLTGFVWFDIDFSRLRHALPIWRNDWRLETDPAAMAAFRRAAQSYRHP